MDVFDKEKRSKIMKCVKSYENKSTELYLIKLFKENEIKGWRRSYSLFGKPDFVFLKQKIAVFVDGCFWHDHNCRNTTPSSNTEYWVRKINNNKKRDKLVNKHLKDIEWFVIRIWECELKKNPNKVIKQIKKRLIV